MGLDIRIPMGLMFAILGLLLALFGLGGDKSIYERSLGININLAWGVVLLIFGGVMLMFGRRGMLKNISANSGEPEKRMH